MFRPERLGPAVSASHPGPGTASRGRLPVKTMTEVIGGNKGSSNRAIRWTAHPAGCPCNGTLEIDSSERGRPRRRAYLCTEAVASDGRLFRLQKPDGTVYDTFVSDRGHDSCSCAGGCWRPDSPCCHLLGLL